MVNIPGANLLKMAFKLINKQGVIYYRAVGRTLNNVGQNITQFAPGVPLFGSFQPVPRRLYQPYGLDLQKDYYTFYASANIIDVIRNSPSDQLAFNDLRFQIESDNDWYAMDGWKGVLCVAIGRDGASSDVFGFGTDPATNTNMNFNFANFFGTGE
jgi:hypothetical protein